MLKKMSVVLAIGIVALSVAACGNQVNHGQAPASAASGTITNAAATSQPSSYELLYRTTIFLGDSITEGLSYHDVLKKENVLAGAGKTAEFAMKDVDDLAGRKPERVFIQLGSDDILWPTADPKQYSLKHYAELIDSIKAKLPKAKITLLTVTPVTADAEKAEPRYRNIGDYNKGLKALAAKKQVGYVDLTPLVAEHSNLYDKDGIHFQAAFYPFLLDYLKDRAN
ncbi:GDSL-type esterase/lipase family protein [Paenibacillus hamazuiensis]|uniref:GDSL-type esterase/lipase family protein n=1 Tax=Paenibacillus hamazuiensis TaxID=2936508 RepID=UPI00200C519D|nr:GDSL-type esterase/lipase family protein [Paenibacillus hamazuiensis]